MWSKDLQVLQDFSFDVLKMFVAQKGATQKQYSRGYKFFVEGYIQDVWVHRQELCVKSKCFRSQKKTQPPHNLSMCFQAESERLSIKECHCSCEVGLSQSCQHVIGLGYYLQDLILRDVKIIPDKSTCTSKPMSWNKPRGRKITPENIMAVQFVKPTKVVRKKGPVQYRYLPPKTFIKSQIEEENAKQKLCRSLKEVNSKISFAYLLDNDNDDISTTMFAMQAVSNPVVQGINSEETNTSTDVININLPLALPVMESTSLNILISEQLPDVDDFFKFTLARSEAIEIQSRQQSKSPEWYKFRHGRFTASNFAEGVENTLAYPWDPVAPGSVGLLCTMFRQRLPTKNHSFVNPT